MLGYKLNYVSKRGHRSSTAMVVIVQDTQAVVFPEEEFQRFAITV